MKYKRILIAIIFIATISTGTFTYAAPVSKSLDTLKKQISMLQAQLKGLQQQLSEKDLLIKDLRKQLSDKDIAIKEYQSKYLVKLLDIKYSFDGVELNGQYNEGNTYAPQAFIYNDIIYSPIRLIGSKLEKKVAYDEKLKTIYINSENKEQYMSEVLTPMYFQGMYATFSNDTPNYMTIAGKKYYNGFCIFPDASNRNITSRMTFSLDGKYENIKGLIGLQDGQEHEKVKVEVYGNNKLLGWFQLSSGDQPVDFDIDVKGVYILEIVKYDSGIANLVNLIIK